MSSVLSLLLIVEEKKMDLFEKEEKRKEILDNGNKVILTLKSNGKYIVEVSHKSIKVSQKGVRNSINRGLVGTKTFSINRLSGVQYKKPGFTTGYLQFILMGSGENKRGVFGAVSDENSIVFSKKEDGLIRELKEFIEYAIENPDQESNKRSDLSDLEQIKHLMDEGIITQEEFIAKKKQILGL